MRMALTGACLLGSISATAAVDVYRIDGFDIAVMLLITVVLGTIISAFIVAVWGLLLGTPRPGLPALLQDAVTDGACCECAALPASVAAIVLNTAGALSIGTTATILGLHVRPYTYTACVLTVLLNIGAIVRLVRYRASDRYRYRRRGRPRPSTPPLFDPAAPKVEGVPYIFNRSDKWIYT
eukprot:NODE_1841_length_828_cov_69.781772_g1452_i0.p1 GENE.NODE_1841_length_828_cov_69.781772_g1452_i0~~NODE_1841_length_828_cov_69.781772_g1452_i0.p1  ORF type:complete len:200 (+),score=51.36 NODE_1841_length_828_cov_69.781772_g1452_i0:58-600(+)